MLSFFRKRASLIKIFFGFLLALMSVTMVIQMIPGIGGNTMDPNAIEVVAEVGGEKITTFEVQQGIQQLGRSNQVPSEMLWLYTEQVLDQMVLEKASVLEAQRMGLRVSQEDLLMRLRLIPDLYPGGKFVGREQYESMVLERFGTPVADFETRFRNNLLMEKLRQVVTDAVGVNPQEVRDTFIKENEKLVLRYVFLESAAFKKEITATDAVLQEYYQKNTDAYRLPEQRRAKILLLETKKVRESLAITDAEKRKYYQDHLDNYRQQERVSVRHILLRATDKEPEKLAQARKKAEELLKQLKAGAKFEDLAKASSEDTASAVKDGDLGWIVRGQTVPNFEKAAFSLKAGALSEPVQTEFGIHLLQVTEHEDARVRPLEEVQAEIQSLLLDEKAQNTITAAAEQAAADLRRDFVDAQKRDRAEDEHLQEHERRQHLDERRPGHPHDRHQQVRPEVAELGRRQLELTEKPALGSGPDLVSALEVDPPVVGHRQREHSRSRDLETDERAEHGARPFEQAVDRAAGAMRGRQGRASDRHRRRPSDTRPRCARFPRAGGCVPRSRRALARVWRRHFGVADRRASSRPRRYDLRSRSRRR